MPDAPLRACSYPCCATYTRHGRCPAHTRIAAQVRGTTAERGYGGRWQRLSKAFKWRHPICGDRTHGQRPIMSRCFDAGLTSPAEHVDHVTPHKGNQALFWDEDNWQSLCASCHAAKSGAGL